MTCFRDCVLTHFKWKEHILKTVGNQTIGGNHCLPYIEENTMEVNGYRQLFGYILPNLHLY